MVPQIRIKGYKGEWNKVALGNLFTERREISTITHEYPQLSFTIAEGVIRPENRKSNKRDFLIHDKDNKRYLVTHYDDIIYNPANVIFGAIHRNGLCNGVVSPIYKIFSTEYNSKFMECVVRREEFIKEMTKYAEGTVKKLKTLKPDSFLKLDAYIAPSIAEQDHLASFFNTLDKLVSTSSSQLESLKQIKTASLQAMFPQEGATKPKVRFKGFEGKWQKIKAESIFKTFNEKNRPDLPVLSATQDRGMVTRESIGYNIFHDKSNEATYKHILPGQFVIHLRSFQGGFAHSEIEGIASPAYTIMEFKDKDIHHDYFWRYIFMSKEFIKRLELITYGIRDGRSISYDEFKEMYFLVPNKDEQLKIASYLRNIDKQIDLQTQRLEKLKQIKAAFLDKMFV